jgi:hypothetical protein
MNPGTYSEGGAITDSFDAAHSYIVGKMARKVLLVNVKKRKGGNRSKKKNGL